MADYIFLRYGNQPNPQVTAALGPIVKRGTNVPFTALPGVMITGFTSDLSEVEIKQKLSHLNIKYDLVKKSGSTGSTSTPAAAPDANRTKTKAEFQAEIQAALDIEDYDKAAELRDDMNTAYPPADDTAESMITNIAEFRAVYESAIPTNESNGENFKRSFDDIQEPELPFKRDLSEEERTFLRNNYPEHSFSKPDANGRIILGGGMSDAGKFYLTEEDLIELM